MEYALVGFIGFLISLIINNDTIFKKDESRNLKHNRAYRFFLYSIMAFLFVDGLWGALSETKFEIAIFIDTSLFFLVMAITVLFWANYVINYIKSKNKVDKFWNIFLLVVSWIIFTYTIVMIIINFFPKTRILFSFGNEPNNLNIENYDPNIGRYILLILQLAMFMLTSIVAFFNATKARGVMRYRHFTIGGFGLVMVVSVGAQLFFPELPIYSMGLTLGICLVHTFVISSEKEEFKKTLSNAISYGKEKEEALSTARSLAYQDPLTGAQSKHAYVEMEDGMDHLIAFREIKRFAVVVFDVNGLKHINDTKGHEYGDKYIKDCYQTICNHFKSIPVYRFGGDEFVVILKDLMYERRDELKANFDKEIEQNLGKELPVVSSGMSVYDPKVDNTYRAVFMRADEKMYERKKYLKGITNYLKDNG